MMEDGPLYTLQVCAIGLALYASDQYLNLVSAGQEEVVNELVGAGADVNRKNDKGITPLFVSALAVCLFTHLMALQTLCSVKVTY
jgi:ankyrin repeat protein